MAHRKKKNPITLDPTRLCKQSVIGCTVLPSRDDPTLVNGIALTTLMAYDADYVKFEDIDGQGEASYRYWKDVYLIVAWNDPKYRHKPLKNGDKIFALFQNADKSFTTVYYNAKIRALPHKINTKNQIIIDFQDGTNKYVNITQPAYTNIHTKDGIVTVPTIIRQMCAQHTSAHDTAMEKYARIKKCNNKPKINENKRTHKLKINENKRPNNVSITVKKAKKNLILNIKHKKIVKTQSNSPNVVINAPKPVPVPIKNVVNVNSNTRKRKFAEINTNSNGNNRNNTPLHVQSVQSQPPLKRQRSSRKKQKLKKAVTSVNNGANNGHKKGKNMLHKAVTSSTSVSMQKKPKMNKRIIKIKRKPKVKVKKETLNNNILPQPPSINLPIVIPSKSKLKLKSKSMTVTVGVPMAVPTQKMHEPLPPPPPPPVIQQFQRKKFKKMWGNYDVEMPTVPHGFDLFDGDLYLDNLGGLVVGKNKNSVEHLNDEYFMSGLGLAQKWMQPQEIGEITVGLYVVDIEMFDVVSKL